jgi:2-polyprenyl-6-methoxyphenol hydroxylase-like FAD-dependent oxidoreductase
LSIDVHAVPEPSRVSADPIDVLIVGAGPTGLVLAVWLTRLGVRVRIVDKTDRPGTTSRALAVHARTLELYAQIGLAPDVVARGRKMAVANLWVAGRRAARAVLGDMGAGLSPFPYALILAQDDHERLLIDHLSKAGIRVERQTELVDFAADGEQVTVRLKRADGTIESCAVPYLAGCDGAHSTVRDGLAIGFPGGTYSHLFYVADVEARGAAVDGELQAAMDRSDFLVVFPLSADGHARLIGTVRESAARSHGNLSWDDVSTRVIDWLDIDVRRVNWFSTYRVHHRVADHFRKGRAFLIGDAGHIHSPVGGQGMNTGIGDAVNLAWKLAAVVHGRAHESILETYEPERIAFARRLVATTDRAFTAVTSDGILARALRLHVAPRLVRRLFAMQAVRRYAFRTVSQTLINYRASRLSEGRTGRVRGGDRLPWVSSEAGGDAMGNFAPLASLAWQVHVYGTPAPDVQSVCEQRRLSLQSFPWTAAAARAGVQQDAVYLVRPDGYVALAHAGDGAAAITSYLDTRGLMP